MVEISIGLLSNKRSPFEFIGSNGEI